MMRDFFIFGTNHDAGMISLRGAVVETNNLQHCSVMLTVRPGDRCPSEGFRSMGSGLRSDILSERPGERTNG